MQAQPNPSQPTWAGLVFTHAMSLVELEIYQHDKSEFGWKKFSTLFIHTPIYWDISSLVLRPKSPLILATRPKLFWKGGPCYTNWTFDSYRPLWTFSLVTISYPIQCSFYFFTLWCLPKVPFEFINLFTGCTWGGHNAWILLLWPNLWERFCLL